MITTIGLYQLAFFFIVLLLLIKPLGLYMAAVYEGKRNRFEKIMERLERVIYRICGVHPKQDMGWTTYVLSALSLNLVSTLGTYFILRFQHDLPLNPEHFAAPSADLAFNIATSYVSNTNWQSYAGEATLSYFSQMVGLTVQNFLSAATGMAILIALIRGMVQRNGQNQLGNFWVDLTRGVLYILLPLSFVFSLGLVAEGVIQNLHPYVKIEQNSAQVWRFSNQSSPTGSYVVPMGPVASQVAIKQLGTNGGGFFNANSAHPFENPTPVTNFLETLALLLIPASFCYTFGVMVRDRRQGWAILCVMLLLFIPFLAVSVASEQQGTALYNQFKIDQHPYPNISSGGNMEGKETRFGIVGSALWSTATAASSNGSVNSTLDSYTPLGGMVMLCLLHLGGVVFGGVGSGLYGMLMIVIITVFVAGLMVGRTPEYLGKKIEAFEIKIAALVTLFMPLTVLILTAFTVVSDAGIRSMGNPGPHGLSEVLYAFSSMANNNGSSFAGLDANTPYFNLIGGVLMLMLRFGIAIPVLAFAGSMSQKKSLSSHAGTLVTYSPLFILLVVVIAITIGALSFLPALALGPIVESLMLGQIK